MSSSKNGTEPVYTSKHVIIRQQVHHEVVTDKQAGQLLSRLEQVIDELSKLLEPAKAQLAIRVEICLLDPRSRGTTLSSVISADPIIHIVYPEDHDEQLLLSFISTLVQRWLGKQTAAADFFLQGLTRVILARLNLAAKLPEINATLKTRLDNGQPLSIFPLSMLKNHDDTLDGVVYRDAATSFVAFLIDNFDNKAFRQFLEKYDGERQDQASLITYRRTLGQLEEAWLALLRKATSKQHATLLFLKRILPLLKPYWFQGLLLLLFSILGLSFNVVIPFASRFLFDSILPQKNIALLFTFSLGMFVFFLVNTLMGILQAQTTSRITQLMIVDLQKKSFTHLQNLSHHFYAHAKVGDLMSRLSLDTQRVQQAVTMVLGSGTLTICNAVIAVFVLLSLHPLIGGLILIVIPPLIFCYSLLGKRSQQASMDNQKRSGESATAIQENISAHATIKAFSLEPSAIGSYYARLLAQSKAAIRLAGISALFQNSLMFATLIGQLLVFAVGGYLVIGGFISVGTMLAAWITLPSLFFPIAMFGNLVQSIQTASGSMDRIIELQDEPITVKDSSNAATLPLLTKAIRLEQVTFSYENDHTILNNLSLVIPAGATTAIVGPSGSGKSSIINLLLRFWDPERGHVIFDDYNLREVTLASLRGQIGLVFQDTFIFDTTIRENIALGRPDATDSEVRAAARGARLDEYIESLPAGYNTVLGERGVRMSGGQRQRLAIARALLRNPRILIFDEATSALDAQTEREILETIDELKSGRTIITITHRLTIASAADHILVLEQGRLVEQGTHDELLQQNGLYQRLHRQQVGHTAQTGQAVIGIASAQLRSIPLFQDLRGDLLDQLLRQIKREHYSLGEYIVRQGEPGDTFYLINYGRVEVLLLDQGKQRRIGILDEGEFFGEMALLVNEPRNASVRAIFPTECYVLTKAAFSALLDQEPAIQSIIVKTLDQRHTELATIHALLQQRSYT